DSFKQSMSPKGTALAIKHGFQEVFHSTTIYHIIPIPHPPHPTTQLFKQPLNPTSYSLELKHPLNTNIMPSYQTTNQHQTPIIQIPPPSPLPLFTKHQTHPSITTSYPTPQLINHPLNHHLNKIILPIARTATNDPPLPILNPLPL
ncbi:glycerate kinase, partial [Staphylococcus epidermidis]|uniref:glycerate kinase n=1 Tax=Staphylococcus epidermidis TaxID=1282 RepID=UPI00164253FF